MVSHSFRLIVSYFDCAILDNCNLKRYISHWLDAYHEKPSLEMKEPNSSYPPDVLLLGQRLTKLQK